LSEVIWPFTGDNSFEKSQTQIDPLLRIACIS
jgi:hypothetical protein